MYKFNVLVVVFILFIGISCSEQKKSPALSNEAYSEEKDVVESLETITLKIGSRDVPFYIIVLSNSTMKYLSAELQNNSLEQTAYIHKNYYDTITRFLTYINNIFKEKRVFTDEEIDVIKNVFFSLNNQYQELISETYDYRIDEDSFPDKKYHGLQTSLISIVLMYSMAHFYASSCITENYQIADFQEGIKNLSTGISREETNLYKEFFPRIYQEMLIKKFVVSTNTNSLPSIFSLY
jgi:hypothetical protein